MTSKQLQHRFSAFQQMRPRGIIHVRLARIEFVQPVFLLRVKRLGARRKREERFEKAVVDEYRGGAE